jgi:hypothetical protein
MMSFGSQLHNGGDRNLSSVVARTRSIVTCIEGQFRNNGSYAAMIDVTTKRPKLL